MKGDRGWSGLGWTQMSTWRWSIESVQSGQLEWVVNVPGWLFVYGYETNAGDVFPGIPEKGFIFPHCFQEDFDVNGVSNMFLPQKQCSRLQWIWICLIGSMRRPAGGQLEILAQTNDAPMWQRIWWACDIWCVRWGHQSGGRPWQQINTWQRPSVGLHNIYI